jgi:hypothetical protein
MSPSTPRAAAQDRKPPAGLSFAFPLRLPEAGTGVGSSVQQTGMHDTGSSQPARTTTEHTRR